MNFFLNNHFIYHKQKPDNTLIIKVLKIYNNKEWIKFYVTIDGNLYYECSEKHPISSYNFDKPINIFSHLYFILKINSNKLNFNSLEFNIFINILNSITEYLRVNSKNCYTESLLDPVVYSFYTEHVGNIHFSPLNLSYINFNLINIKEKHNLFKNEVIDSFNNFNKDFMNSMKNINEILSKINYNNDVKAQKVETISSSTQTNNKSKKEFACQYSPKNNVKENYTQTKINQKDKEIQTDKELQTKTSEELQTKTSEELQTKTSEEIILKKNKKKSKKEEELITFTVKEYSELIQEHKNDLENLRAKLFNEVEENFKNNFLTYIFNNPLDYLQISTINMISGFNVAKKAINIWGMQIAYKNFKHASKIIKQTGDKYANICVLPFMDFWLKLIIPNITKFKEIIFTKMLSEWIEFQVCINQSALKIEHKQIDISFSFLSSNYFHSCYENYFIFPPFFSIIIAGAKDLSILMTMIKVFEQNYPNIPSDLQESIINDFHLLYTSPKESIMYLKPEDLSESAREKLLYSV